MAQENEPVAASRSSHAIFLLALVLLAVILVVAAQSPPAVSDARLGRRVELVELIRAEQARVRGLAAKVDELSAQIAAVGPRAGSDPNLMDALNRDIERAAAAAGVSAMRGPGLLVVLTDSSLKESPSGDINDLVIHEQDLQSVINALWAGGAEGISVNGQRVLAITAIRCVGNTLLLHGAVYSPPYRIRAVGDAEVMRTALDRDPAVQQFRRAADEFELGFSVSDEANLLLPTFEGAFGLRNSRPAGTTRT